MNKKKLVLDQLDVTLRRFGILSSTRPPNKGWIRAIRDSLGMTAKQLAARMGVAQQAVARLEKAEPEGSVTIKTMRRVADALDCQFVCGFVPKSTLNDTLRKQAYHLAARRLNEANQTMALEDQALSPEENKGVLTDLVDELVDTRPSALWDEE